MRNTKVANNNKNIKGNRRRNRRTKKDIFAEIIARLIYYIIISIFGVACILLFFGTLGAVIDLVEHNKIYCICYFVVTGCIITKWIIEEINR